MKRTIVGMIQQNMDRLKKRLEGSRYRRLILALVLGFGSMFFIALTLLLIGALVLAVPFLAPVILLFMLFYGPFYIFAMRKQSKKTVP